MYTPVNYTEERACDYCHKPFIPNRKDKKYCKKSCGKAASARRQPDWSSAKYRGHYGANAYKRHKKNSCECCGFTAVNRCQLDVDHMDGDHSNNSIENLQTLCANCHRLKSWMNKEFGPKEKRPQDFS